MSTTRSPALYAACRPPHSIRFSPDALSKASPSVSVCPPRLTAALVPGLARARVDYTRHCDARLLRCVRPGGNGAEPGPKRRVARPVGGSVQPNGLPYRADDVRTRWGGRLRPQLRRRLVRGLDR